MTAFNIVHGRKLLEFMGRKFYFDVDEKKMCMQKSERNHIGFAGVLSL